jgi:hypothetical protein
MPVVSSQIPLLRKLYQYTTNGMVSFIAFPTEKGVLHKETPRLVL